MSEEQSPTADVGTGSGEEAPQPRRQRSALMIFTQSVLILEALATFFATLVFWSLARSGWIDVAVGLVWPVGLTLIVAFILVSGVQQRRWGIWLGWALQAPMLVLTVWVPEAGVVGVAFLLTWAVGVWLGRKIDRERAERDEAVAAAEDS